jgi:hypothetical protein
METPNMTAFSGVPNVQTRQSLSNAETAESAERLFGNNPPCPPYYYR